MIITLYWNAIIDQLFAPVSVGDPVPTDYLWLPRQDTVTLRVQACISEVFTVDSDRRAPEDFQFDLSDLTGTPIFGIKSVDDWLDEVAEFAASAAGYDTDDSDWHDLSKGCFSMSFTGNSDLDTKQNYRGQFLLLDADDIPTRIPGEGVNINFALPVILGSET